MPDGCLSLEIKMTYKNIFFTDLKHSYSTELNKTTAKMKVCMILLAILGLSYGAVLPETSPSSLPKDFYDFFVYIDMEKIIPILAESLKNNQEVKDIIEYMTTDDYYQAFLVVASYEEIRFIVGHIQKSGLDILGFMNQYLEHLGHPPITRRSESARSWSSVWEAVKSHIDIEGVKALFNQKLVDSPDFKELYLMCQSGQEVLQKIGAEPKVKESLQVFRELGVDIDKIIAFVKKMFQWE